MSWDTRERLRMYAGDERFRWFLAALEKRVALSQPLHYWQEQLVEEFVLQSGIALPLDPTDLLEVLGGATPKKILAASSVPAWCQIDVMEGEGPVQGWGTCGALRWYFRARGESWTLGATADPAIDPVDVEGSTGGFFREEFYGDGRCDASHMPLDEARHFVVETLSGWLERKADRS